MKRQLRLVILVLVLMLSLFVFTSPVLADTIASPDSGPFITQCTAYENTYETGDILIMLEYYIPYATLPATTAAVNFVVCYINPASTVLQSVAPFAYHDLGYNYGAAVFYWAPTDPNIPTWGEAGTVRLLGGSGVTWGSGTATSYTGIVSGSPVSLTSGVNTINVVTIGTFTVSLPSGSSGTATSGTATLTGSPVTLTSGGSTTLEVTVAGTVTITLAGSSTPTASFSMAAANWTSSTMVAQGRAQVCQGIVSGIALDLQSRWGLTLTSPSSVGTILNASNGQEYFSNIIPYFTTVCSAILTTAGMQPVNPPPTTTYNKTYEESLMDTWPDAVTTLPSGQVVGVGVAIQNASNSMGMTTDQYLMVIFLGIMAVVMSITAATLGGSQFIPLLFTPILVGCIKIGVVPMAVGVGLCAILVIISLYLLIHRRAPV